MTESGRRDQSESEITSFPPFLSMFHFLFFSYFFSPILDAHLQLSPRAKLIRLSVISAWY